MRQQAEDKVIELQTTLQAVQSGRVEMEQRLHALELEAEYFRKSAIKCYEGINRILPMLEGMKPELFPPNHDLGACDDIA